MTLTTRTIGNLAATETAMQNGDWFAIDRAGVPSRITWANVVGSLGTIATQNADSVAITGGSIQGVTGLSGLAGPTATTSGVAIDFTDIPTDAVRIEVLLQDCRVDGGRSFRIQIGAGTIEETGYAAVSDVNGASPVAYTDAFGILPFSAAGKTEGIFHLHLADPATNLWVASYSMRASDFGVTRGGGRKAISGPIERLRVRTSGPDVFNSGAISLRWSRV